MTDCSVCGDPICVPSNGGCAICWHGIHRGALVSDVRADVMVHQSCLDWFGVDNYVQFEKQYIDLRDYTQFD